ncbi:hypothetical protein ACFVR6_03650 [Microbacterium sp. NPDC058021]|uniref:hypothetical protein n=1 Tax=Microbacterium sp. NPDC058021 TaxID=3346306 RepID=UPI0036D81249
MTMESFHHTLPDGHQITLPRFENVPMGIVRKTRRMTAIDQIFTILEELLSESDLEHIDKLDRAEFNDLSKKWQETSSITPGESTAS